MNKFFGSVKKWLIQTTNNEAELSAEERRRLFIERKLGEAANTAANRQPDDIDQIAAKILSDPVSTAAIALNGVKASL